MQAKYVYNDFIDEYVDEVTLVGQAFTTDAVEVHNYIVRFTSGNTATSANMVDHASENYGRLDFISLKDHYEGVGMRTLNLVHADKVLNNFSLQVKRNHKCSGTNLRGS